MSGGGDFYWRRKQFGPSFFILSMVMECRVLLGMRRLGRQRICCYGGGM